MKILTQQNHFLMEKLVQEETTRARRPKIRNLLRQIRDWWNQAVESSPDYDLVNERIQEMRTKYSNYRVQL